MTSDLIRPLWLAADSPSCQKAGIVLTPTTSENIVGGSHVESKIRGTNKLSTCIEEHVRHLCKNSGSFFSYPNDVENKPGW